MRCVVELRVSSQRPGGVSLCPGHRTLSLTHLAGPLAVRVVSSAPAAPCCQPGNAPACRQPCLESGAACCTRPLSLSAGGQKLPCRRHRVVGEGGCPVSDGQKLLRRYHKVVGEGRCPVSDTYWQTETGAHLLAPLPGVWPQPPGSATLPFFGVQPAVLDEQASPLAGQGDALQSAGPGEEAGPAQGLQALAVCSPGSEGPDRGPPALHRVRRGARTAGRLLRGGRPPPLVSVCVHVQGTVQEGPAQGLLALKASWPSTLRTVYGDHARYETTYFAPFKERPARRAEASTPCGAGVHAACWCIPSACGCAGHACCRCCTPIMPAETPASNAHCTAHHRTARHGTARHGTAPARPRAGLPVGACAARRPQLGLFQARAAVHGTGSAGMTTAATMQGECPASQRTAAGGT